jgi:hypothetical protein
MFAVSLAINRVGREAQEREHIIALGVETMEDHVPRVIMSWHGYSERLSPLEDLHPGIAYCFASVTASNSRRCPVFVRAG